MQPARAHPGFNWMMGKNARSAVGFLLVAPALIFLFVFLVVPAVSLLVYSVMTQAPNGDAGGPLTLDNYIRLFSSATYVNIAVRTVGVSLATAIVCSVIAYPLAMVITYGGPTFSRVTMMLVVAPLVVSVVVRTYGWQLMLANSPGGVVNWVIGNLGGPSVFLKILYTQWAVVVASVHVFLPLMVLPLASSLARIPANLNEAGRILGAPAWRAFALITFPLSMPGLAVGFTLVFVLTSGSFLTSQMVGGPQGMMLGVLLEQQINVVYDWPMGAAIATLMVVIALGAHIAASYYAERRLLLEDRS